MFIQHCNVITALFSLAKTKQIARDNIVASVSGIFNLRADAILQYPASESGDASLFI